jgi:hypothetical protein
MRFLPVAFAVAVMLSLGSLARGDYSLIEVTPQNVNEVEGLSLTATSEPNGTVRFTVVREAPVSRFRSGLLRLHAKPDAATEVYVRQEPREDATEYRFAIAKAHLDIAEFNLIEGEGLGGTWYRIPLQPFAPAD